jgi:protocatechuate 4,5-dioxygenase beta chain
VERGFDPSNLGKMQPLGNASQGMSHMLIHPHPRLVPELDIPVVPIFLNENFPPLPTGQRCWELGLALRDILMDGPERIVLYASGGLSHDPRGPRAGWIDEPLDNWVLERIKRNESKKLVNLFTFDSDTLRGGTGEIRAWIAVAAGMQRAATVLDYFPSHHAKCGLAFAYWPEKSNSQATQ